MTAAAAVAILFLVGCSILCLSIVCPKKSNHVTFANKFLSKCMLSFCYYKAHYTCWSFFICLLYSRFCTWKSRKWTMNNVQCEHVATTIQKIFHLFYNCVCVWEWCIVMFTCAGWSVIVLILVVLLSNCYVLLFLEKCFVCG